MKYNKKEIMKKAWEIRRSENTTMAIALKKSWAIAKAPAEIKMKGSEKQVKWANDIIRAAKESIPTLTAKIEEIGKKDATFFYKDEALIAEIEKIEKRSAITADIYIKTIIRAAEEKGAGFIINKRWDIKSGRIYKAIRRRCDLRMSEGFMEKNAMKEFLA